MQRNFKRQIAEPVEVYLNKAAPTMWDDVLKTFKNTLAKAESSYLSKARSKQSCLTPPCGRLSDFFSLVRLQLH